MVLVIKTGPRDGREDGEHTGVDIVEMFEISAMHDPMLFGMEPFYRVYSSFHLQIPIRLPH